MSPPSPVGWSNKAGCGRSPGSDDELAGLGLDTGPRRLKTTHMQAKEKSEAFNDALYSLSDWYKISVRPTAPGDTTGSARNQHHTCILLLGDLETIEHRDF